MFDDYNGRHIKYTAELIRAQIDAVEALGFNEWILWGAYPENGLVPELSAFATETTVPGVTTTVGVQ